METAYFLPTSRPTTDDDHDSGSESVEYFQPTGATVSVWASTMQHGGPPAGLLMRALLRADPDPAHHFTRVTTEILGPIGLGINRVRSRVVRPGRQIAMVEANLDVRREDGTYRTAARSVGWRLKTGDSSAIARGPRAPLGPLPGERESIIGFPTDSENGVAWGTVGFIGTVESVTVPGRNGDTPAVWLRPTIPLVDGEETSDLESQFTVLDVANGMGTRLRPDEWTWMNTDTTVHLTSTPEGPWLGIDADMAVGREGFGATFADLYDTSGFIGRSAQTVLLVGR
ncbi:thioesterase family protein [Gordonia soli]|uniref:Thioesterase family protein n=1 Tax=Gordonia soli NBRC 108243 TaxID=1223545 RepID=M0QPH5_9ACTN|nr:thioesterase family protein [Gordonia soli]GAC70299.1 hypothetical protein GS4_33_01150 [Gordonia soli NBRC 108243]